MVPATQSMHTLNDVGTFIWQECDGRTADEVVGLLVEEFEVDDATARGDLEAFVGELTEKRMLGVE